nr:MAG TPA: hypothetical protein [Caudoviricetes sp.]
MVLHSFLLILIAVNNKDIPMYINMGNIILLISKNPIVGIIS